MEFKLWSWSDYTVTDCELVRINVKIFDVIHFVHLPNPKSSFHIGLQCIWKAHGISESKMESTSLWGHRLYQNYVLNKKGNAWRWNLKQRYVNNYFREICIYCDTIVVKAMCDLMSNDHPNAPIVQRPGLTFTKEWGLKNTCRKYWEKADNSNVIIIS